MGRPFSDACTGRRPLSRAVGRSRRRTAGGQFGNPRFGSGPVRFRSGLVRSGSGSGNKSGFFYIFLIFSISVPKSCFFLDSENITFIIFNFFKKSRFFSFFRYFSLFSMVFHYILLYFIIPDRSGSGRARSGPGHT